MQNLQYPLFLKFKNSFRVISIFSDKNEILWVYVRQKLFKTQIKKIVEQ